MEYRITDETSSFSSHIEAMLKRITEDTDMELNLDIKVFRDDSNLGGYLIYVNDNVYADGLDTEEVIPFLDTLETYVYGYLDGLMGKNTYQI